jgi:hypothetical protein
MEELYENVGHFEMLRMQERKLYDDEKQKAASGSSRHQKVLPAVSKRNHPQRKEITSLI